MGSDDTGVRQLRPHRPKIALVVTVAASAGLMRGFLRRLTEDNFDVHFVSAAGPRQAMAASEGATVHTVDMSRSISPVRDLKALRDLWQLFRQERFDLIHVGTPKASLLGMLAALAARVPVRIHTLHGLVFVEERGIKRFVLRLSDKVSLRLATHRFAVSNHVRQLAITSRLAPAELIKVLGAGSFNGIDTATFQREHAPSRAPIRGRWEIAESDLVVGFVGRMVPAKGVGDLVQAMQEVWQRVPRARLVLVGPSEPRHPLPSQVVDLIQLDRRVVAVGPLDGPESVREALEAFDVLVLPSWREGFGNVLLEAASMETPAVGTLGTGCSDAIADAESGLLVPAKDHTALAEAIVRLLENPLLRERLGRCARVRAQRLFEQEQVWERQIDVYRQAIGGHAARR